MEVVGARGGTEDRSHFLRCHCAHAAHPLLLQALLLSESRRGSALLHRPSRALRTCLGTGGGRTRRGTRREGPRRTRHLAWPSPPPRQSATCGAPFTPPSAAHFAFLGRISRLQECSTATAVWRRDAMPQPDLRARPRATSRLRVSPQCTSCDGTQVRRTDGDARAGEQPSTFAQKWFPRLCPKVVSETGEGYRHLSYLQPSIICIENHPHLEIINGGK